MTDPKRRQPGAALAEMVPLWQMLAVVRADGYEVVVTDDPNAVGIPLEPIDEEPEETR